MSDPIQLTGEVSQVYNNAPKYPNRVLVIDGNKYGDYDGSKTAGINKGDTVSFTYKASGQYLNVFGKATVVSAGNGGAPAQQGGAPAATSGPDARQVMIMKQNAVGHAVNYVNKNYDSPSPEQVIAVAKEFLAWYLEA